MKAKSVKKYSTFEDLKSDDVSKTSDLKLRLKRHNAFEALIKSIRKKCMK